MKRKSSSLRKYIIVLSKIIIAAACLVWVGRSQDWAQIKTIFMSLDMKFFLICAGAFFLSQIIVALRWNFLLRAQSVRISNMTAIKLHLLGLFYNNFLPSSIGGDFLRAWYVAKHTDKKVEAAFSVFFDRALGLSALIILAMAGYFSIIAGHQFNVTPENQQKSAMGLSKLVPMLIIAISLFFMIIAACSVSKKGRELVVKVWRKEKRLFVEMINSIKLYAKKPKFVLISLILTYFAQSINILGLWVLGNSLGIEVGLKYYFVFFPISWVVGAIPISIGGIGVIEGLLTLLFISVGSENEPAFALSLCQRALILLISLPGIWIHLVGAHLPGEEFFVDSNDSIV